MRTPPFQIRLRGDVTATNTFLDLPRRFVTQDARAQFAAGVTMPVATMRQNLVRHLWKASTLPYAARPESIQRGVASNPFPDARSFERLDRLVIRMDAGLSAPFMSYVYHYRARVPNRRLVILHDGHWSDGDGGRHGLAAEQLLTRGYDVLIARMPNFGENDGPLDLHGGDPEGLVYSLESAELNPLRFFVEPVVVALNELQASATPYLDISMLGASGGGWSTTFLAALDTRIRSAFEFSGTIPSAYHDPVAGRWERGAYEIDLAAFFSVGNAGGPVDYQDLYILAATGRDDVSNQPRRFRQILSPYDACCYMGVRHKAYERTVRDVATGVGGDFRIFRDDSHNSHFISPFAFETFVLHELESDGVRVVDDNAFSDGFERVGAWTLKRAFDLAGKTVAEGRFGLGGDAHHAPAADSARASAAIWRFPDVLPGRYRISATWLPAANATSAAWFEVWDGQRLAAVVERDQRIAPAGPSADSVVWSELATLELASNRLQVILVNRQDGIVIADAVRLEPAP